MKKIFVIVLVVLVLGLGGFWLYSNKTLIFPGKNISLKEVSLRLKWINQAQFAGNYVAADKGFYADEGIKVDIQPIDLSEDTIQAVADGKIDFSVSGADEVILARAKGTPVKAVAVIYKINPAAVISLAENKIKTPEDLIGKKIGLQKGNPIEYLFDLMLENKGIKQSQIHKITVGYDASELLNGKIDALVGYVTNEPDMVVQAGQEPSSILMADYGVGVYADVLVTSDKLIQENPDLVQKFVSATLKGWQYAIENASEAVDITLSYAKDSSRSHETYMLTSSIPLINAGGLHLGVMDDAQWKLMQGMMTKQKLLTKTLDIADAYTNQFAEAAYK